MIVCNVYAIFFFQFCHRKNTYYRILVVVVVDIKTFSTLFIFMSYTEVQWKNEKLNYWHWPKKRIVENVDKGMLFYEYYVSLIFVTFDRFVCFCLFVVLCPTGEYFTYMETSTLLAKSCKCWPILGSHGHWAMRIRYRSTHNALAFWAPEAVHPTETYLWLLYSITGILIKIVLFCRLCKPIPL